MSSAAANAVNAQAATNGPTPVVDTKEAHQQQQQQQLNGEDGVDSGAVRTATNLRDYSAAPAAPKSSAGMMRGSAAGAEQPVGRQVCDFMLNSEV